MQCVIVVRHGERLDYVERDVYGRNWVQTNKKGRPWDPPLTNVGMRQATDLGVALQRTVLDEWGLPPIGGIYSSPFLRCRQTASGIVKGHSGQNKKFGSVDSINNNEEDDNTTTASSSSSSSSSVPQNRQPFSSPTTSYPLLVRVELGLSESINENWYRSWALPESDGTWGYKKKEIPYPESNTMHPDSIGSIMGTNIMNWKDCPDNDMVQHYHHRDSVPTDNDNKDGDETVTSTIMDYNYQSVTSLGGDFSYHPNRFESKKMQRSRMEETMSVLSDQHIDETIVLVSHGGPVTHLYENLTGNHWTSHGECSYCSFSVYIKKDDGITTEEGCQKKQHDHDDVTKDDGSNATSTSSTTPLQKWIPLIVNRSL